jgi:hypothetical protein
MLRPAIAAGSMAVLGALAGQAMAQGSDIPARFAGKNVCQYIAGIKASGPLDYHEQTGLFSEGLARGGLLDLDGDGVMERVAFNFNTGTMGGDAYSIWKADGTEVFLSGVEQDGGGYGAAFLSYGGRWYFVIFAAEGGAFVHGAFGFAKGTLDLEPICKFENDTVETMFTGRDSGGSDQEWCNGAAVSESKSGRLKPVETLDDAAISDLDSQMKAGRDEYGGPENFAGSEIYAPTIGPFAGLKLWKVNESSGAGRGCAGSFFRIVEGDGAAYKLSHSPLQTLLNQMQAESDDVGVFNCVTDVALFEANDRFFLDRSGGDEKPVTDQQLNHVFVEALDGQAKQICRGQFDVTPRVVWESAGLPK